MSISTRKEQILVNEWARLLRALKVDIADDYRASDDSQPGMRVTFGLSADGSWSYQTGDNSFTGGAYGHPFWGVISLYRRGNCKDLAQYAFDQCAESMTDEVQS